MKELKFTSNFVKSDPLKHVWRKVYWGLQKYKNDRKLSPIQREVKKLMERNYDFLTLDSSTEQAVADIKIRAASIFGDAWNHYSDALRKENVKAFEACCEAVALNSKNFTYLEIGSNRGISMSLVGLIAARIATQSHLISIDPYFEGGYIEGEGAVFDSANRHVDITKTTRDSAFRLYRSLGLHVDLIEKTSTEGLVDLLMSGTKANLIYIDGHHEKLQPMVDFGLSYAVLQPKGVIVIDDHHWEAVNPVKKLCDKYCNKIYESWKIAAYRVPE